MCMASLNFAPTDVEKVRAKFLEAKSESKNFSHICSKDEWNVTYTLQVTQCYYEQIGEFSYSDAEI